MAFGDRFTPAAWGTLGDIGTQWRLVSFHERPPPTWERFWADHRKYWGVDAPEGRKSRPWFWATYTEHSFLEKAREEHEKLVLYYKQWNGYCQIGETVAVVPLSPSSIALSKNWRGSISDHVDIEIELYRAHVAFIIPSSYVCEVYSYGTITVPRGSIPQQMGESAGSRRVRHNRSSFFRTQSFDVRLDAAACRIAIWDATFDISGRKDA